MRSPIFTALLAVAFLLPSTRVAAAQNGVAAHYSPGVMEKVARVRRMVQPAGTCMIARLTRADLGRWYRVQNRITGKVRCSLYLWVDA
jgi:hypothetical protein